MKQPVFTGSSVAIITPFTDSGAVNYEELGNLIEFQIENHTDSITICGTTGEGSTLSDAEHREAIKALESWILAAIKRGQEDVDAAARAYRDQYRAVSPYSRSVADHNQRRLNNDLRRHMWETETHVKRLCKIQAALTSEAEKIRKD